MPLAFHQPKYLAGLKVLGLFWSCRIIDALSSLGLFIFLAVSFMALSGIQEAVQPQSKPLLDLPSV